MGKYTYDEDMVARMHEVFGASPAEEAIETLMEEFGYPYRSITAKARKEGIDVPSKPRAQLKFSDEETAELRSLLESNEGVYTAEEIASQFAGGKFNARQINGKALSLELTNCIKPAEKKVTPKTFTPEQEATVQEMAENGAYLEDIAEAVGKNPNQVRGKLLSMGLKAPQKNRKETKSDAYAGIEDLAADMTVAELAAHFDKSERGVKTVLTRRGVSAKDYTPKVKEEE